MRPTLRTPIVLLATAAVLTTIPAAASATRAASPEAGLSRFVDQQLDWKECQQAPDDEAGKELDAAGARCADVTVPLDYSRPNGRTITIAISRLAATDAKRRVGVLALNSGGPAGTAVDMPLFVAPAMGKLAKRYDLVGMDPRFVGRSTPLDCGWPTGTMLVSAGLDRADFDRSVTVSRDLADRCGRSDDAGLLPFASTRNTARDLDLVRAVLGERKLSYLGYSYGSYLGAVYAELFPRRVDRMVLDGPIDPATYAGRLLEPTGPANEQALADWAAWTAARNATYGLGDTRAEVLRGVQGSIDAAAVRPLEIGDYRVDVNQLPMLFFALLGSDLDRPRDVLARAARVFADAAEHGSAEPTEELADDLRFLTTGAGSAQASAQAAIICADAATPGADVEQAWLRIERERAAMPFAAPLVHNVNACDFWPTAPREPLTRVNTNVKAMIVAATGDPRTIYPNAAALRRALSPRSRVVTLEANQHGMYGEYGDACIDATVNAYLATGRLPQRDLTCDR